MGVYYPPMSRQAAQEGKMISKNSKAVWGLVLVAALAATMAGCPKVVSEGKKDTAAPVLFLSVADRRLTADWIDSTPSADTYDIYYKRGKFDTAEEVKKGGTKLDNKTEAVTISGLTNGQTYSVVITANKKGYTPMDSEVRMGRPAPNSSGSGPGTDPGTDPGTGPGTDPGTNPGTDPGTDPGPDPDYLTTPGIVIISMDNLLICEWTLSRPSADTYDVYYRKGEFQYSEDVREGGVKLENQTSPVTINGLTNGDTYSVVVSANKEGFEPADSVVRIGKPGSVSIKKSDKRGVSYNFNTNSSSGANTSQADMDLLAPGITWFYDWGHRPQRIAGDQQGDAGADPVGNKRKIEIMAAEHNIEYMPMAWSDVQPPALRRYKELFPECRYVLAYNEPNLISGWESAYQLPSQAASIWPKLKNVAQELGLKIVSPAMALVGDPPVEWLDAFFSQPGVSLNDVAAIAIHSYLSGPSAFRDFINSVRKYNKPIWMTEWCAWDGGAWNYLYPGAPDRTGDKFGNAPIPPGAQDYQIFFLSQTAMYMELDPTVEKYAWFIPKRSGEDYKEYPWMDLITKENPPKLTDIGKVFVYMSTCDKGVWVPVGQTIEAKDFTSNNLAEWTIHSNDGWQNSVTFRPAAGSNELSILDIWFDRIQYGYMWTEYQVYLEQSRNYTLTLRYSAPQNTPMTVYVDGKQVADFTLTGAAWQTKSDISLGNVPAGKHTIRLRVTGDANSSCGLNWLKVD